MSETEKIRPFTIISLNYVSLYFDDLPAAIAYYTAVFGEPETAVAENELYGWRMGNTWLTLFSNKIGTDKARNPANAEFAIQVSTPEEVDILHQLLIEAGGKDCWTPEDTEMYDPMRFSCVDDPFGVRIDVYCPIERNSSKQQPVE